MANNIIIKKEVSPETGEILDEKKWLAWDGWKDDAYKFRYRAKPIKFYPDAFINLDLNDLKIFFAITMLMNDENLLMSIQKGKTKFDKPELQIYSQEDIRDKIKYKISRYSFIKAWQNLNGKYIKRIVVNGRKIWAINPVYANRCDYVPLSLYKAFKLDMERYLSPRVNARYKSLEFNEGIE